MRIGLSWDLDAAGSAPEAWRTVLGEIQTADGFGFDSIWLGEGRNGDAACPSPSLMLTFAARRTKSLQLRAFRRGLVDDHAVRVAEEIAVLDLFSRGRAGVCFAPDGDRLWERIDFVCTAWTSDEFRYHGDDIRFPAHTPAETPKGASSAPPSSDPYVPQWERGPAKPDYLSVTPKPYASKPPVWVEVRDTGAARDAARRGVPPFLGADLSEDEIAEASSEYRTQLASVGVPHWAEIVIERRFDVGDDRLVERLRALAKRTGSAHLVWRRTPAQLGRSDQLFTFATRIQPLLQT